MKKVSFLIITLAIILLATGCTSQQETQPNTQNVESNGKIDVTEQSMPIETNQYQTLNLVFNGREIDRIQAFNQDGKRYVPLVDVLESLDYTVKEKDNLIQAGVTDVFIEIKKDSNSAIVDRNTKILSSPLITQNNETFIMTNDLVKIFGAEATIQATDNQLKIQFTPDYKKYGFPEEENLDDLRSISQSQLKDIPVVALNKANRILDLAQDYLGVPYVFGAEYTEEGYFDCSSYTRYVFYKQGLGLPRTARQQARMGNYVPVKNLRKGDLLFFHWPGRNVLVGHVGIYAGNGYMIHSSPYPKDGVQITNLKNPNTPYRKVYLGAKRISEANDIDF